MALITVGSLDDFAVVPDAPLVRKFHYVKDIDRIRYLAEASSDFPQQRFRFAVSAEPRGFNLKSLRLEKRAQNLLSRVFKRTSKVYFLAWSWDLSGEPVYVYPPLVAAPATSLIPLKAQDTREFLGSGVLLFPARLVTGGIQLRVQIWVSHGPMRGFGTAIAAVCQAILNSDLNKLLTAGVVATTLAPPAGLPINTMNAAKESALLLGRVVGEILKKHGDDVLDLFEGNYEATMPWSRGNEAHDGYATKIVLTRTV